MHADHTRKFNISYHMRKEICAPLNQAHNYKKNYILASKSPRETLWCEKSKKSKQLKISQSDIPSKPNKFDKYLVQNHPFLLCFLTKSGFTYASPLGGSVESVGIHRRYERDIRPV